MSDDKRDVLEVLKFELSFLEQGGYGRSVRTPWKAPSVLQDSPRCLNFNDPARPHACSECLLTSFVPGEFLEEGIPCHFIPLNDLGETVDSLERHSEQPELEEALKSWLRSTIARLEIERLQREKAH
jgi:hypothetical protein